MRLGDIRRADRAAFCIRERARRSLSRLLLRAGWQSQRKAHWELGGRQRWHRQASETVAENIKRPLENYVSYAIYDANCSPRWQLKLSNPHGAFAMSGSWSVPRGDGTTDSGSCAAHAADAILGASGQSKHPQVKVALMGNQSANSNGTTCNGSGTFGSSGLSPTDMDNLFATPATVPMNFPSGPVRKFSLHLQATRTSVSSDGAGSYSLTWDMKINVVRIGGLCTYLLFDTCGIPPH